MVPLFSSVFLQTTFPACTQAQKTPVSPHNFTQVENGLVKGHCPLVPSRGKTTLSTLWGHEGPISDVFTSMCLQGSHGSTVQSQGCNELNLKLCPSSLCSGAGNGAGNASRPGLWKSRVSYYRFLYWAGAL